MSMLLSARRATLSFIRICLGLFCGKFTHNNYRSQRVATNICVRTYCNNILFYCCVSSRSDVASVSFAYTGNIECYYNSITLVCEIVKQCFC